MDHRTIVSFFTCQLVWVNRYSGSSIIINEVMLKTNISHPGIQIISATLMDEWREVANC